jgi:hypothetical protein
VSKVTAIGPGSASSVDGVVCRAFGPMSIALRIAAPSRTGVAEEPVDGSVRGAPVMSIPTAMVRLLTPEIPNPSCFDQKLLVSVE